jgi:hypothetical protein
MKITSKVTNININPKAVKPPAMRLVRPLAVFFSSPRMVKRIITADITNGNNIAIVNASLMLSSLNKGRGSTGEGVSKN